MRRFQDVEFVNGETEAVFKQLTQHDDMGEQDSGPALRRRLIQLARHQGGDIKTWLAQGLSDTIGEDVFNVAGEHLYELEDIGGLCSELLTMALFNVDFPAVAEAILKYDGEWEHYQFVLQQRAANAKGTQKARKRARAKAS